MKRNTILYIVIFVVLGITATLLMMKKTSSTLPELRSDFAVTDTAAITKIHMTDHYKNDIVLERKSAGIWMVNGKYKVNQSNLQVLLETIRQVKVKNPVPIPARENFIKDLAVNGIKVEIYSGENLVKSYFVGSSTADDEGTIMCVLGSSEPFVTWVPGFVGYLTTRYITKEQDWRSTEIYHLNPADIKLVSVAYPSDHGNSFTVLAKDNKFTLTAVYPEQSFVNEPANEIMAKRYLSGFQRINFESFPQMEKTETDSILQSKPFAIIKVSSNTETLPELTLYTKVADDKTKTIGNRNIDLNRFYGTIGSGSNEIVMIQTYVIGKLLAHYTDLVGGK